MGQHTYHLSPRQRYRMVADRLKGRKVSEICRFHGIPRKTFYYWLDVWRADQDGFARNVAGGDRTPKRQPRLTGEATTKVVVRLRKRSGFGPKRLKPLLAERGIAMSESGIGKLLRREGASKARRRKARRKFKKFTAFIRSPGERVQTDVAYLPKLFGRTHRQYAYQAIDLHTRLAFSAIYGDCTPQNTVDFLRRCAAFFPFRIEAFQFDHGAENTYDLRPDVRAAHPVERHLAAAGIRAEFSPVATPRMNGCVERLHRSWREECARWHAWPTPAKMHRDNARWLKYYNEQRPHQGIGGLTPAERLRRYQKQDGTFKFDYSKCYFTV